MFWNPWGVRRHAHLALVHTSIEHSRDWCRSLLILNCQELAAQQPLRPINWCSRLRELTHPCPARARAGSPPAR
ncbi:resolvase (plasmid) [Escherichia coli]|nr:resolvase [Escherichia coli]